MIVKQIVVTVIWSICAPEKGQFLEILNLFSFPLSSRR